MPLVEILGLTKRFRKGDEVITPLDDVDLAIAQGEFVSLMGSSGSGKSTLLNLIAGIDRADAGQILVGSADITRLSRRRLADWRAAHLGYVFQMHNLVPVLTAYENVELPLLLLRMSRAERRNRVELALEVVGLTDRADHYPRQLSGGQEQRVGVARAIVAGPALVVADEPTGNLDAETGQQIQDLLRRLNVELGMTLLMVTHDAGVAAIAGRQLRLERGQVVEAPVPAPVPHVKRA
jgi:putative ABC transport system ATP-binding protein